MNETTLAVPTVHLNGTSCADLMLAYEKACSAIRKARESLPIPNARDFYVQGPDAFGKADREYCARAQKLIDVQNELEGIWEALVAQERR